MTQPVFITSNQHKADYLARQLGIDIAHEKVELDELQSTDLHVIVEHKLRQAYEIVQKPVIVEDTSLGFTVLGGLPGPFIKFFITNIVTDVCCRMLDAFDDRSATIHCTFGYFDGKQIRMFDSEMKGSISKMPRGENGFGFDKIFVRDGDDITLAEYDQAENERIYAEEKKPFAALRDFLRELA